MIIRCRLPVVLTAVIFAVLAASASAQISNLSVRAVTANISSGNFQCYEQAGIDIFKALKPDIVAIQEFKASTGSGSTTNDVNMRALVDTAFGTNFYYFKQTKAGYSIPNGIVSRWPILTNGTWADPIATITDRGFAWALIDLPGTNPLYVVSLHLYSSGTAAQRDQEAQSVKSNIVAYFPANAWILVGGDFNTASRSEAAVTTFKTFLSDYPIPTDQAGDADTNAGRSSGGNPYDYILPSFNLTNYLTSVVMPSHTFTNGLVFDTRVYTPTNDFLPAVATNSAAFQMQHMAVVKNFLLPVYSTNASSIAPSLTTQPQSRTNTVGTASSFFVVAAGTAPLTYQWRLNGTNLSGATTTNYIITSVQTTNAGNYTCIVTNLGGKATSDVATLTVLVPGTPPNITTNPVSQTNLTGTAASFSVGATGTAPLAYQWLFNNTNISGANTDIFSIPSVHPTNAGNYLVIITNFAGSATSTVASLTVTNMPPADAPTLSTPSLFGDQFIFQLTGTTSSNYIVQVSTNLATTNWVPLQTNPAPFWFTNPIGLPQQFFRGTVAP